ncbi:MAG TPA: WhiB family transcriptional regulator [Candidatus Saccharimonadales bacterium]|nr:WhiB family transcriptional regulator [Candidatus Saccharimonadales bacterium]
MTESLARDRLEAAPLIDSQTTLRRMQNMVVGQNATVETVVSPNNGTTEEVELVVTEEPNARKTNLQYECGEDPELFYSPNHFERKQEKDLREGLAKAMCRRCTFRQGCLQQALDYGEDKGIWGGLNELERKRLLRRKAV